MTMRHFQLSLKEKKKKTSWLSPLTSAKGVGGLASWREREKATATVTIATATRFIYHGFSSYSIHRVVFLDVGSCAKGIEERRVIDELCTSWRQGESTGWVDCADWRNWMDVARKRRREAPNTHKKQNNMRTKERTKGKVGRQEIERKKRDLPLLCVLVCAHRWVVCECAHRKTNERLAGKISLRSGLRFCRSGNNPWTTKRQKR